MTVMSCYVALLRGINVSGKNIIRMDELQDCFLSFGYTEVKTYLQSGNVVFHAGKGSEHKLAEQIQRGIGQPLFRARTRCACHHPKLAYCARLATDVQGSLAKFQYRKLSDYA